MSEALYQAEIVARARAGAADSRLEPHDARAAVDNPLCGDRITLDLRLVDGKVAAIGHRTRGCALCQASAETLRSCIPGHTTDAARGARDAVKDYLAGGALPPDLAAYAAFAPVRDYPSRHSCVLLPLDALVEALPSRTADS
jgi:nitrogen fixation protein NifU and related proteins